MPDPPGFLPLSRSLPYWPADLVGAPAFLDEIGLRDFDIDETTGLSISGTIVWLRELSFDLPGLDGFALAFLADSGLTVIPFQIDVMPDPELRLPSLTAALRFRSDMLMAMREEDGLWIPDADATGQVRQAEISLSGVGLAVDGDGDIEVTLQGGAPALSLGAVQIGETGVVIEVDGLRPYLSEKQTPPAGAQPGFKGVALDSVQVHLPRDLDVPIVPADIELEDLLIGTGGFSGTVRGNWTPTYDEQAKEFTGNGAGSLFSIPFALESLEFSFAQNSPTGAALSGAMVLPFFDQPLGLDLAVAADGDFAVALSAEQPDGVEEDSGLITFEKEDVMRVTAESVKFSVEDGVAEIALSGAVTPLLPGITWPTFHLDELSIDSEGNVKLAGGWLDLREAATLEFYGFRIEITQLGFGKTEDGGQWVGFSGGVKLVDGLPAGASVEGLRLVWYEDGSHDPYITLNGVGVELAVPGTFSFKGAIAYRELEVAGEQVKRFDGEIHLAIECVGLEVDAVLVIGSASGPQGSYTFFAIYLAVELPVGIPLGQTGLGFFGAAALFALNMEPDKLPGEEWYEGWYKRPQIGVTDLRSKWVNKRDSLALGGGVTIGTVSDNGFTFAGRFLLVIVIPGPIIMIEGKANLLKERATLTKEPLFRALVLIDGRAGDMVAGLDVAYKYEAAGELVDIRGGVEAYFNFKNPNAWHIYVGRREPREKRVRAGLFELFEANAYLMLDPTELAMGAWVGFDESWAFGPLSVTLEAWLEANAKLSFKPPHFTADAWLHGKVALAVLGFGLNLSADAILTAEVDDPTHIIGDFSVKIDLPWPLPDYGAAVTLEWGPDPVPPPVPAALKEVSVEHLKASVTWPLPRGQLLVPSHADAEGFLTQPTPSPATQAAASPPANAPVVPLDARPHLSFGRAVHDDAFVSVNVQPPSPAWERIGDPEKGEGPANVRYGLTEVALHRWTGTAWQLVARKGKTANPSGVPTLYGSWAPVPTLPSGGDPSPGQTKLWLWSKSPYDWAQRSGGSWSEWFEGAFPAYPCIPPAPDQVLCFEVEVKPGGTTVVDLPGASSSVTIELPRGDPQLPVAVEACVALDRLEAGGHPNPLKVGGPTFLVCDWRGDPFKESGVVEHSGDEGPVRGLDLGFRTEIELPCTAVSVSLTVTSLGSSVGAEGFDDQGNATAKTTGTVLRRREQLRLRGRIRRVVVYCKSDETLLHELCWTCAADGETTVVGIDGEGGRTRPSEPKDGIVVVTGKGLVQVVIENAPELKGSVRVCADIGPDPADVQVRQEMAEHVWEATERWSQESAVLEPDTQYRLTIGTEVEVKDFEFDPTFNGVRPQTEYAYFRTQGPPGLATLSTPIGLPANTEFQSGLDDLTRYVQQTVPPTVPGPGERPTLPRPVYRAYDVGVEFNENYVESMYARARRDLGLYLFDNNNRPVRDPAGRLLALTNSWGAVEALTLRESDAQWVEKVNAGNCARIDTSSIPHDRTLASGHPGQLLDSDTVYEARLIPLLLHERFTTGAVGDFAAGPSGTLGPWTVRDFGSGSPSRWEIGQTGTPPTRFVHQTVSGRDTALVTGDAQWSDYRLSAWVRAEQGSTAGLLIRYGGPTSHYRLSLHPAGDARRLVKVSSSGATVLASDDARMQAGSDHLVAIEVAGDRLLVVVDGEVVFDEVDATFDRGQVGLWADGAARFSTVRVDDLRAEAPVPYRFKFTSSRFASFTHQLHSHDDDAFVHQLAAAEAATLPAIVAAGVAPTTPAGAAEARAYEDAATAVLGQAARQDPARVEVVRVASGGQAAGLLVRSPEPIDWKRTSIELLSSAQSGPAPAVPGALKIAGAVPGAALPNEETVDLVARSGVDPARLRIERRAWPGALAEPAAAPPIASLSWTEQPAGQLVLAGDPELTDCRVAARLRADGTSPLGVVLRYVDADNLYRVSVDRSQNRRRLVRRVGGVQTVLWEGVGSTPAGEPFELRVQAVGDRLVGHLGDLKLFDVVDPSLAAGRAGVFRTSSADGRFLALEVDRPSLEAGALFSDAFDVGGLGGWNVTDLDSQGGPSAWSAANGTMQQTSGVQATAAVAGGPARADAVLRVRLQSSGNGGIGAVLRWADASNHYRFSMDRSGGGRRLVKVAGGVATILWQDAVQYESGRVYELTAVMEGDSLRGYLDGVPLFSVRDSAFGSGRVGLLAAANPQAQFQRVEVYPLDALGWEWLLDEPAPAAGDVWGLVDEGSTELLLAGALDWADQRLSARMHSAAAAVSGLVFHYRDYANHYRFENDPAGGARRLVRVAEGVSTVVWQDSSPVAAGQTALVTIDCDGDRKTGYVNGVRIFEVDDAGQPFGLVGLLAAADPAQVFADVRVGRPRWCLWHRFEAGGALRDGSRQRVHSGNRAQAPPDEPLVERRFRAWPGERGVASLPVGGADLRLVDPSGGVLHARRARSAAEYTAVPIRLLRKQDGTGMWVSPASGSLAPGAYRLKLTFRRDNRAADPDSQVLRQAGQSGPEVATIEIPWQARPI